MAAWSRRPCQRVKHEGIGLIPLAEGGEVLWRELASLDRPAEVVVLAGTNQPESPKPAESDPEPC